jgi:hypothetical protein
MNLRQSGPGGHRCPGKKTTERGATNYTLTEKDGATATTTEQSYLVTGVYTRGITDSTNSSIHQEGNEGTAGEYTLDKTAGVADASMRSGNYLFGNYTLSGASVSVSTAIESQSYGDTFTEILLDSDSYSANGNDGTGGYKRADFGYRDADFEDAGTESNVHRVHSWRCM